MRRNLGSNLLAQVWVGCWISNESVNMDWPWHYSKLQLSWSNAPRKFLSWLGLSYLDLDICTHTSEPSKPCRNQSKHSKCCTQYSQISDCTILAYKISFIRCSSLQYPDPILWRQTMYTQVISINIPDLDASTIYMWWMFWRHWIGWSWGPLNFSDLETNFLSSSKLHIYWTWCINLERTSLLQILISFGALIAELSLSLNFFMLVYVCDNDQGTKLTT